MVKKVSDLDVSNTPLLVVPENSKEAYFINPKFLKKVEGISSELFAGGSLNGSSPGGGVPPSGDNGGTTTKSPSLDDIIGTPVQETYYDQGVLKVKVTFTIKNSSQDPIVGFDARIAVSVTTPVNTAQPFVTPGTGSAGSTLFTSTNGTWSNFPTLYEYQWKFNDQGSTWVSIAGATNQTYTPPANYVSLYGSGLRCYVTATNEAGTSTIYSNTVTVA